MTDLQREALAVLSEVWSLSPDVRFGQLLAHLGLLGEVHLDKGLGYIEDEELIAVLHRHRAELEGFLDGEEADEANYFHFMATLRIHGEGVPFEEISQRFGVQATHLHRKGDRLGTRTRTYRD